MCYGFMKGGKAYIKMVFKGKVIVRPLDYYIRKEWTS